MGFFIETFISGLMAGMLYSLVALGFVLIFKASGVFNFAQGAMVLFAALAMARFAEWIPPLLGLDNQLIGNLIAFVLAGVVMFVVAWLIERLVLRHLVNQEGTTLLMATLGISYFLDGVGQSLFGSDIYSIDVGMPKEPMFILESTFQGGILISKEDVIAALVAAALVALLSLFFQKTKTGGAARIAGGHPGRADLGAGRHHRRPDHRRRREALGSVSRALCGRRHRDLVCLCAGPAGAAGAPARPVRREDHRPRLTRAAPTSHHTGNKHVLQRKRPVQDNLPG